LWATTTSPLRFSALPASVALHQCLPVLVVADRPASSASPLLEWFAAGECARFALQHVHVVLEVEDLLMALVRARVTCHAAALVPDLDAGWRHRLRRPAAEREEVLTAAPGAERLLCDPWPRGPNHDAQDPRSTSSQARLRPPAPRDPKDRALVLQRYAQLKEDPIHIIVFDVQRVKRRAERATGTGERQVQRDSVW
jgi:hypothetical protein